MASPPPRRAAERYGAGTGFLLDGYRSRSTLSTSGNPTMNPQPLPPQPKFVLWLLWFAITFGLVMIYSFAAPKGGEGAKALQYLPMVPLAISVFIRWVLLPRQKSVATAMPVFIIGLAMAEGCGILGMFLVPQLKETYLVLALLGLFQFAPLWAGKLE